MHAFHSPSEAIVRELSHGDGKATCLTKRRTKPSEKWDQMRWSYRFWDHDMHHQGLFFRQEFDTLTPPQSVTADPPPQSFHASRTGGAARYSLLDTFRDQIRHFNAGGDLFEMDLTDREDYVEWYATVSTGPILPPHMRIGSNYAIRGGQAASRIAELRRDLDTIIRERDTSLIITARFLKSLLQDRIRELETQLRSRADTKLERALSSRVTESDPLIREAGEAYLPSSFLMAVQRGASRTIDTREESREQTISRRRPLEESLQEKQKVQNWMIKSFYAGEERERRHESWPRREVRPWIGLQTGIRPTLVHKGSLPCSVVKLPVVLA
ncbi:hypothetical protein Acr_00g0003510 [Actinidia rufa]|uniref:Uncharacterized protein n=1 Tax=Actinidia rufa TaxID=165716 RepID=A0A7J0D787_9ERIC|nr:hypothetical protein Acr_00g0003510 [Actinidia rufa]